MAKELNFKEYTTNKVLEMFDASITKTGLINMEDKGVIPVANRKNRGKTPVRYWSSNDLPLIGEKIGFFKKPYAPKVITFYTQKGGSGKTPLAFQLARTLALHNIKVLVIGLDSQETITTLLGGLQLEPDSLPDDLEDLYIDGLYEIHKGDAQIKDAILSTDLPNLDYIPENAGITALEMAVARTLDPLKVFGKQFVKPVIDMGYDYIIFDCNPYWGRIINSVLYASDIIVSPLACNSSTLKINKVFFKMLNDFEEEAGSFAERLIIPTLLKDSKLSRQVRNRYETTYSNICTKKALKESVVFDEAQELFKSIAEYQPNSSVYKDLVSVFREFQELVSFLDEPNQIEEDLSREQTV